MSSGKCKLKEQWDATTYLLEWLKFKTLTVPNAGEDVEQEELSFTAARNAKWDNHFGKQFGSLSQK